MDKLASQLLFKSLDGSYHLSDLDSDEEETEHTPVVQPVVPVKYETLDKVKVSNAYQEILGRISLVWTPPENCPNRDCPESYHRNTEKEKLLLWYCENFRRQYSVKYPARRPLVLALLNECGVQKMVCTSINITRFSLTEFKSWQGCARFISDHIAYQVLDHPTNLPTRLRSPHRVFMGQCGHAFELSTLLVSLLLGAKIDAYVVSGYATREVCNDDQCRVNCPLLPGPESEIIDPTGDQPVPGNKYVPKIVPDYKSKFEKMMEQRRVDEEKEKKRQEAEEEKQRVAELEKLPPDELKGKRLHSWVLIKAEDVFFVEPITGRRYELDDEGYLGIESIWNNTNYWLNLQTTTGCKDLDFTLDNQHLWQPLLLSGPRRRYRLPKDRRDRKTKLNKQSENTRQFLEAMSEKYLDIPATWTRDLEITLERYIRGRYKHNKKQVQYRRAVSEQYSDNKHPNGLVERVVQYVDLECEVPSRKYEKYKNRADKLYYCDTNYENERVQEFFEQGRQDGLQYHRHLLGEASELRSQRTLDFHLSSRLDSFQSAQLDNNHFRLSFINRSDKLREIFVEFLLPRKKRAPSILMEQLDHETQPVAMTSVDDKLEDPTKSLVKLSSRSSMITKPSEPKPVLSPKTAIDSPKTAQKPPPLVDSPKTARNLQKPSELTKTVRTPKSPGQSPKAGKTSSDTPQPKLQSPTQSKNTLHPPKPESVKAVGVDRADETSPLGKQDIRSFYVSYDRSSGKHHDEDVSKIIFNLQHGEISVYYHYGENNITQSYHKFQTALSPDDLPETVKCYRSDSSTSKPDSKQALIKLYDTYTRQQAAYLETINRYVAEIRTLLNSRKIDRYKPKLVRNIFYLEIDEQVKAEFLRGEAEKREAELRQLSLPFNYAEFYLTGRDAREFSGETLEAKSKCLEDLIAVWKKRVEHFEGELLRVQRELDILDEQKKLNQKEGKNSRDAEFLMNRQRREALENERELIQRVLAEYQQEEMFREKCSTVEMSFQAYVQAAESEKGSEWAKIRRTVKTEAH